MNTMTTLKHRVLFALTLCGVLAYGAAMANDPFQSATMRDAVNRNDSQLLTDTGGASFMGRSGSTSARSPSVYRDTMLDALARNDTQLLSGDRSGGATFLQRGSGYISDQEAYSRTMRNAFDRHDTQLLPESYAGGATFFNGR